MSRAMWIDVCYALGALALMVVTFVTGTRSQTSLDVGVGLFFGLIFGYIFCYLLRPSTIAEKLP